MYHYENEKSYIFTDQGQRDFIKMRDHVMGLLKLCGVIMMENAMHCKELSCCTNWGQLALVDRMVEIGDIVEIASYNVAGQHRIFRLTNL